MKNLKNSMMLIVLALFSLTGFTQNGSEKIYLTISHEVADYASWKPGFEEHSSVRKEAGMNDIFVKQDVNNTNSITAFFEVTDLDKAKAFLSSPELKEAMTKAGVSSAPVISFYRSADEYSAINTSQLVTVINHTINDYSVWKPVYDEGGKLRESNGITDNLVLRSLADENSITVLGCSSSVANFNAFMSNPDLKGAMEKAGVSSEPVVNILF